jgi:hypothetical protein
LNVPNGQLDVDTIENINPDTHFSFYSKVLAEYAAKQFAKLLIEYFEGEKSTFWSDPSIPKLNFYTNIGFFIYDYWSFKPINN